MAKKQPKCMTGIESTCSQSKETIISRQLRFLQTIGISDVIITTGKMVMNGVNAIRIIALEAYAIFMAVVCESY